MPDLPPAEIVNLFFGSGQTTAIVPREIREDYRESFILKFKVNPEDNAAKFTSFLAQHSKKDTAVKRFYDSLDTRVSPGAVLPAESSVSQPLHPKESPTGCDLTGKNDEDSSDNSDGEEDIPPDLIFSPSLGSSAALDAFRLQQSRSGMPHVKELFNGWTVTIGESARVPAPHRHPQLSLELEYFPWLDPLTRPVVVVNPGRSIADCLAERQRALAKRILESNADLAGFTVTDYSRFIADTNDHKADSSPQRMYVGRVVVDSGGPANEHSLCLEGFCDEDSDVTQPAQLIFTKGTSFALVPNQVVAVLGTSTPPWNANAGLSVGGQAKIFVSRCIPGLPITPAIFSDFQVEAITSELNNREGRVAIVAGPFTAPGCFDLSVFEKLIQHMEELTPDLIVVLGPFVDTNNHIVAAGNPALKLSVAPISQRKARILTYYDLYQAALERLLTSPLLANKSQILLIPSVHDVLHRFPIPQPPLDPRYFIPRNNQEIFNAGSLQVPDGILLGSNPCSLLLMNQIRMSICSCDLISPLATGLVTSSDRGTAERPIAACEQLLSQATLFPLYPGSDPVNSSLFDRPPCVWTTEATTPHIIVYSSYRQAPNVRSAAERLFINCGKFYSRHRPSFTLLRFATPPTREIDNSIKAISIGDFLKVECISLVAPSKE